MELSLFEVWLVHRHLNVPKADTNGRIRLRSEFNETKANILLAEINKNFGRGLKISIRDRYRLENHLSFSYEELTIPPNVERKTRESKSFDKYVFVYARYTEQMSMSMLNFLSLCGQAQFGGRKVVRPFVRNSKFVSEETGTSLLGILFDLNYLNSLLDQAGYSPLVDKQEYKTVCKQTDPNHVTIHILYNGTVTKNWNKNYFKISNEFYDAVFEKTKLKGWTECPFLDARMGIAPSTKQFCINLTIVTDWKVLEKDIVRDAKCLNILLWRGIGGGKYRS